MRLRRSRLTSSSPPVQTEDEPKRTPASGIGSDEALGAEGTALEPPEQGPAPAGAEHRVVATPPRTRISAAFSSFVAGAIILILLLIFILENTQSVKISWLGLGGHIALGVALLLAAVGGALLVGILGVARIGQVRRHSKRHARQRRH